MKPNRLRKLDKTKVAKNRNNCPPVQLKKKTYMGKI